MVFIVLLAALGIVIGYRKMVGDSVDDFVHVADESTVAKQETVARTLRRLDRIVTILIIVTVIYAITVAGLYSYRAFNAGSTI
jgi:uncharacterized membrane protein